MRRLKVFSITGIIFLMVINGAGIDDNYMPEHSIIFENTNTERMEDVERRMPSFEEKVKSLKEEIKEQKAISEKTEKEEEEILENDLSDEDKLLLAKAIYAEAGICDIPEQEAVGLTILNRAKQGNCSIYEVLTAQGQFSSVINGKPSMIVSGCIVPIEDEDITSSVWDVVESLCEGRETEAERLLKEEAKRLGLNEEEYAEGGPLYFYNPDYVSQKQLDARKNVKCSVRVGYQIFYKVWDT